MMNRINYAAEVDSSRSRLISIVIACLGIVLTLSAGLFIAGIANSMQVLMVFFGLVGFIFTFARLEFGVAAMIFILYTQTYIIVGERYGITNIIQGLIMLLLLSMATRWIVYTDEIPEAWIRPAFLVLFYCLVGLASVLYAERADVAMPVAVETLKSGIIALIIAVVIRSEKSFRLTVWILILVGIFLGNLSVFQFFTGTYDNDYSGYALAAVQNISGQTNDYRLGGPVGDPNYFAQMMLVIVPLALDRMWNERQRVLKLLAFWALCASALTVLLTYSRGGFLAMLIVLVTMLLVFHKARMRNLLVVGVVGVLLINVLPAQFSERLGTLTELLPGRSDSSSGARDYSFRGRTSEMLVALQMFADHPVLGVGLGNYPVLYQKYSQRLGIDTRAEVRQAHSLYLEVAAETGLLGLFSFFLLLWIMFRALWRARQVLLRKGLMSVSNIVAAYACGFMGYLLAATFIHSAYPRNFWVLAGIALAIPRMVEMEVAASEKFGHGFMQTQSFSTQNELDSGD